MAQVAEVEKAYERDALTMHQINVLKEIYERHEIARQIIDKRLGWKAAEEPPLLASIEQLNPMEMEAYQRQRYQQLKSPDQIDLPPRLALINNPGLAIPKTDRLEKPIRNPKAYLQAMQKNQKN
jgi:hypothetical protein